jgi:hypothetical protein
MEGSVRAETDDLSFEEHFDNGEAGEAGLANEHLL